MSCPREFDFSIYLDHPYKLCDYKPAYGYIFAEYAHGYDYWGHCDMTDCIFGNLRKFLSDDFLSGADKFMFLGHMTLYRNTDEINRRIFEDVSFRENNLQKIFGSKHTLSSGGVLTAEKCCIKSFMGNLSNAVNAVLNAET